MDAVDELYGPWAGHAPAEVARLFDGYDGLWFVAGGWAIEAFTGVPRPHGDLDPEALRCDLPLLRAHLAGRLHVWTANSGALWPLLPDDRPDADADEVLPEGCGQLWLRRNAMSPWEFDLLLNRGTPDEWVCKRDPSLRRSWDEVLWQRDGVRYLRPEVQLLLKAGRVRPKDQRDLDVTWPMLDAAARSWLLESLERVHPGHPWLDQLTTPD